ncbi:MAG: GtrA family protein [Gammaproteobacteria bacterium]|jgi:putative flippase GtrA
MLVGTAAAAVDFIVVSVLVPCGAHPLVANVPAFAVAFGVSYTGHSRWTFPMGWARPGAIHRFFAVAASGFAINELLYALLLRFTGLSYRESLAVVLIAVAGATFLASKYWAFAHDRI